MTPSLAGGTIGWMSAGLLHAWNLVSADPRIAGIVVASFAVLAVAYVVGRLLAARGRRHRP